MATSRDAPWSTCPRRPTFWRGVKLSFRRQRGRLEETVHLGRGGVADQRTGSMTGEGASMKSWHPRGDRGVVFEGQPSLPCPFPYSGPIPLSWHLPKCGLAWRWDRIFVIASPDHPTACFSGGYPTWGREFCRADPCLPGARPLKAHWRSCSCQCVQLSTGWTALIHAVDVLFRIPSPAHHPPGSHGVIASFVVLSSPAFPQGTLSFLPSSQAPQSQSLSAPAARQPPCFVSRGCRGASQLLLRQPLWPRLDRWLMLACKRPFPRRRTSSSCCKQLPPTHLWSRLSLTRR